MSRRLSSSQKQAQVLRRRVERQEKTNPLYVGMTVIDGMTQPRTMPKQYRSYAKEGYASNDTLYKVINFCTINGAAIQPVLYTDKSEVGKPNGKRIDNHPLLDKLARPNNEQSGVFYRKSILGYFLISGNAFQYAIRAGKSGPPDELWTLSPELVHPIPAANRGIIGYKYDPWPAEKNTIAPELIGHTRSWNPTDEFFGMSPVEVIAVLIDTQQDGRKWNLSLLQNFLKPPGAWTTTVMLAPNDRAKLESRVNEKFAGARNAGKSPVLDGALDWKSTAVPPSEMDWLESMKYNSTAIANVFNMPPELTGDGASTFNNKEMAEVFAYTEYIFPTLDEIYDTWNMWLVPMYPDLANSKAYLYYDKESVEVIQKMIQAQKDAIAERANKFWLSGLATQSEAQELAGLQVNPDGKVYRFGAILVPADQVMDYAEQAMTEPAAPPMPQPEPLNVAPPTPQEKPDANNAPNNPTNKPTGKQPSSNADNQTGGKRRILRSTKALDLSTTEEKAAYAASIEAARAKHENEYEKQLTIYFDQERKAVVKAITSSSATSEHVLAARAEGALNDLQSDLKEVLMDLYKDVSVDIGGSVAAQLSGKKGAISDFIKLFGDSQLKYLLTIAGQKIKDITTTTLAKIRLELTDGVAQGESIPELAKRIDGLYLDQIIPNRSTTIARTEVVSSSNYASIQAASQSGLTLTKVWLATGDSRTREWHADADGQEVPMDEPFDVGGEPLQYPGDMDNGSARNIVNCFPEDTLVAAEGINAATRRWYEGDLIEITTDLGFKLSGTPNHPILTNRGWVALGELQEGDSVVSSSLSQEVSFSDLDVQDKPTKIGEVFDALLDLGDACRISRANVNFHGDRSDSDIDVVFANSQLRDNIVDATISEPLHKEDFPISNFVQVPLRRQRLFDAPLLSSLFLSSGHISSIGQDSSLIGAGLAHSQVHTLGSVARSDIRSFQETGDDVTSNPKTGGNCLDGHAAFIQGDSFDREIVVPGACNATTLVPLDRRSTGFDPSIGSREANTQDVTDFIKSFAGLIQLTSITNVVRRAFCGHVYNLQTDSSWYIANSIISHNCRCTQFFRRSSQADGSDTSSDSEEAKRIKREAYRTFMNGVLV